MNTTVPNTTRKAIILIIISKLYLNFRIYNKNGHYTRKKAIFSYSILTVFTNNLIIHFLVTKINLVRGSNIYIVIFV